MKDDRTPEQTAAAAAADAETRRASDEAQIRAKWLANPATAWKDAALTAHQANTRALADGKARKNPAHGGTFVFDEKAGDYVRDKDGRPVDHETNDKGEPHVGGKVAAGFGERPSSSAKPSPASTSSSSSTPPAAAPAQ